MLYDRPFGSNYDSAGSRPKFSIRLHSKQLWWTHSFQEHNWVCCCLGSEYRYKTGFSRSYHLVWHWIPNIRHSGEYEKDGCPLELNSDAQLVVENILLLNIQISCLSAPRATLPETALIILLFLQNLCCHEQERKRQTCLQMAETNEILDANKNIHRVLYIFWRLAKNIHISYFGSKTHTRQLLRMKPVFKTLQNEHMQTLEFNTHTEPVFKLYIAPCNASCV